MQIRPLKMSALFSLFPHIQLSSESIMLSISLCIYFNDLGDVLYFSIMSPHLCTSGLHGWYGRLCKYRMICQSLWQYYNLLVLRGQDKYLPMVKYRTPTTECSKIVIGRIVWPVAISGAAVSAIVVVESNCCLTERGR